MHLRKSLVAVHVAVLVLGSSLNPVFALGEKHTSTKKEPAAVAEALSKKGDTPKVDGKTIEEATKLVEPKKNEDQATSDRGHGSYDISKGFSVIAEKAIKAVVNVSTMQLVEPSERDVPQFGGSPLEEFFREFLDRMERPRRVQALGSGFIIQSDEKSALIVTNYHVIAEARKITITLHDGTEVEGTVLAKDDRTDVAIVKIDLDKLPKEKRNLEHLEWGDSNEVKVGDWILAIGNPFGLGSTVTKGIISNRARNIAGRARTRVTEFVDDFLQHDASINLGNSGGPIINLDGKIIGINTAIFSPSGGSVGIGFAVPSNLARDAVKQLLEFGRTKRGWLGVKVQQVTEEMAEGLGLSKVRGAIVGSVTPGGPADKAKIESGDVIIEFDGKEINEKTRLTRVVGETPVGKEIKVKLWRKGKELAVNVALGEYESATKPDEGIVKGKEKAKPQEVEVQGLRLSEITPDMQEKYKLNLDEKRDKGEKLDEKLKGVVITYVDQDSEAANMGFREGDLIVQVSQADDQGLKEVSHPEEFVKAVEDAKAANRKSITLLVKQRVNKELRFAGLKLEEEKSKSKKDEKKKNGAKKEQKIEPEAKDEKLKPSGAPEKKQG